MTQSSPQVPAGRSQALPPTELRPDLLDLSLVTVTHVELPHYSGMSLTRRGELRRLKPGAAWPEAQAHALFAQPGAHQGRGPLEALLALLDDCSVPVGQTWNVPGEGERSIELPVRSPDARGELSAAPDPRDPDAGLITVMPPGRPDVLMNRGMVMTLRAPETSRAEVSDLAALAREFAPACGVDLEAPVPFWQREIDEVLARGGWSGPPETMGEAERQRLEDAVRRLHAENINFYRAFYRDYGSGLGMSATPWLLGDWLMLERGWTPVQALSWVIKEQAPPANPLPNGAKGPAWELFTGGHTGPWQTQPTWQELRTTETRAPETR